MNCIFLAALLPFASLCLQPDLVLQLFIGQTGSVLILGFWRSHSFQHPSSSGDQTPPQDRKKNQGKEEENPLKYGFVPYNSAVSLADMRLPQERGSFFFSAQSWVWMNPFRSLAGCGNLTAWVTIYAKKIS